MMSLVARGQIQQRNLKRSLVVQQRHYVFVPLSWAEFRERFERWIEPTDPHVISVQVFSRRKLQQENQKYERVTNVLASREKNNTQWNRWFQGQSQKMSYYTPALPLPKEKESSRMARIAERYQGWKTRRRDDYAGWKARRRKDYEGWKTNRRALFNNWKSRQLLKTKNIVVKEYSQPDWFDEFGRPLTSRDSTGRFVNPWQSQTTNGIHSIGTILTWRYVRLRRLIKQYVWQYENNGSYGAATIQPQEPIPPLPPLDRNETSKVQLTWIGHATCYVQLHGVTILTDPIFSHRAGPSQWAPFGPCREVAASHSFDELMSHTEGEGIDICCITHDHYDHLDFDSIQLLKDNVQKWVVPLGIKEWLVANADISPASIVEMEWWDQTHLEFNGREVSILDGPKATEDDDRHRSPITITCCPASHWGSRNMSDRNTRLWCSFAFESNDRRVFLSGDSGYPTFPLFRQIADTLGPFDLSTIPIGAYEPAIMNKDSHANPYEAVRIHKDLRSHKSVAIHWGTFPLSEEELQEPPMELKLAMEEEEVDQNDFVAVQHGSTVEI